MVRTSSSDKRCLMGAVHSAARRQISWQISGLFASSAGSPFRNTPVKSAADRMNDSVRPTAPRALCGATRHSGLPDPGVGAAKSIDAVRRSLKTNAEGGCGVRVWTAPRNSSSYRSTHPHLRTQGALIAVRVAARHLVVADFEKGQVCGTPDRKAADLVSTADHMCRSTRYCSDHVLEGHAEREQLAHREGKVLHGG